MGFAGRLATALAIGLSLYALYWVLFVVQPQIYRVSFPADRPGALVPVLPTRRRIEGNCWPLVDFSNFVYRAAVPTTVDIALRGQRPYPSGNGSPAAGRAKPSTGLTPSSRSGYPIAYVEGLPTRRPSFIHPLTEAGVRYY